MPTRLRYVSRVEKKAHIQEAFKLALSMVLLYWLALAMDWDMPLYGALAVILISLDTTGASFRQGVLRIVGTLVGLGVGLFAIAAFSQHCWLMLAFLSCYLLIVGYFMQASQYIYAWFVAGFVATFIWESSYGNVDTAFHYAVFRSLETAMGVIIYMIVSALLWPRHTGPQLVQLGYAFYMDFHKVFVYYKKQIGNEQQDSSPAGLRASLVGDMTKLSSCLEAAYLDTPSILRKKRAWEQWREDIHTLVDSLELWSQSVDNCSKLDLLQCAPQIESAMSQVEKRFERIVDLWKIQYPPRDTVVEANDDLELLKAIPVRIESNPIHSLSGSDKTALSNFIKQWDGVDVISRKMLHDLRILAGLDADESIKTPLWQQDVARLLRWSPCWMANAIFPVLCFIIAYVFWIYFNPPKGPMVPAATATIGLMTLMMPVKPTKLLVGLLFTLVFVVAPIYFLLMPRLETGLGLLTLIFCYTFAVGYVYAEAKSKPSKLVALIVFVMATGISNDQTYSFSGLVDLGMMMLLACGIISIVWILWTPRRPEKQLIRGIRRFFVHCDRTLATTGRFGSAPSKTQSHSLKHRYYAQSIIQFANREMPRIVQDLEYSPFSKNTDEKVQTLVDAIQSTVLNIMSGLLAYVRVAQHAALLPTSFVSRVSEIREKTQEICLACSRYKVSVAADELQDMGRLLDTLQAECDSILNEKETAVSEDVAKEMLTLIGCMRGLAEAMSETQNAMKQIDWAQLTEEQF